MTNEEIFKIYELCEKYYEGNGNLIIPKMYSVKGQKKIWLGKELNKIKNMYISNLLSDEFIQMFENIGIMWTEEMELWYSCYANVEKILRLNLETLDNRVYIKKDFYIWYYDNLANFDKLSSYQKKLFTNIREMFDVVRDKSIIVCDLKYRPVTTFAHFVEEKDSISSDWMNMYNYYVSLTSLSESIQVTELESLKKWLLDQIKKYYTFELNKTKIDLLRKAGVDFSSKYFYGSGFISIRKEMFKNFIEKQNQFEDICGNGEYIKNLNNSFMEHINEHSRKI